MKYRLGLDLGSTSIGWTVLKLDGKGEIFSLEDMGSRIFSDGRDAQSKKPLNVARREHRGARRNNYRKFKRKSELLEVLIKHNMMTTNREEQKIVANKNPYKLRKRGLDERLSLYDFGRALFHLGQKRGFKSNRKYDNQEAEKSNMKVAMADFKNKLAKSNCRTIGEYFCDKIENGERVKITVSNVGSKNSYSYVLNREQVEDEFQKLWVAQAKFHSELTEEIKNEIYHAIFWQRDLKPQEKGKCQFEQGEPRIAKAHPLFQLFRIWQEVNNLKIITFEGKKQDLTLEEKVKLVQKLSSQKSCKFSALRNEIFGRALANNYEFNFEKSESRDGLEGNLTFSIFRSEKCFGAEWDKFDLPTQNLIVEKILNEENIKEVEKNLVSWLSKTYDVSQEKAEYISSVSLPSGYANVSKKAIEKLLPYLEKGLQLHEAIEEVEYTINNYDGTLYDEGNLPYYGEVMPHHALFGNGDQNQIPEICYGKIGNPTVHIVLNQLRTIVNLLCKKYGAPKQIVIELARELKLSKKKNDEINETNEKNRKSNEKAVAFLAEHGLPKNKENIIKYKLWVELNAKDDKNRCCPYTGKNIGFTTLFSNKVEIEHILPKSRTFDDSYANKTLCFRQANLDKGNRSPYEAFGQNSIPEYNWKNIIDRVKENLPKNKQWRFYPDAMEKYEGENPIIARMLNDTKYVSKIAREYMQYVCGANNVWTIQGQLTAKLRHHWGLNSLIADDNNKNRADHRHHAIDAFVIACTTRGMLQKIFTQVRESRDRLIEKMPPPFENFNLSEMQSLVDNILVSHKQDRHGATKHIRKNLHAWNKKTFGELHKATAYGLYGATILLKNLKKEDLPYLIHNEHYPQLRDYLEGKIKSKDVPKIDIILRFNKTFDLYKSSLIDRIKKISLSIRRPITEIRSNEIVCNNYIREILSKKSNNSENLTKLGIIRVKVFDDSIDPKTVIPIYDKNGIPYKYFVSGNNYCLDIYMPNRGTNAGKWQMEVISNFQAHQKDFKPNWKIAEPEAKLIMRLFINDIVKYEDEEEKEIIGRVKKMDQHRAYIKNIRISDDTDGVSFSISKFIKTKARKVYISPIGELYEP